jgi:Protein of unknown function (DUF2846)
MSVLFPDFPVELGAFVILTLREHRLVCRNTWGEIMFRKLACAVAICAVLPVSAAYASSPKYSVHHAGEPAISSTAGRIYFYRESSLGGMMLEPAIKVDGNKVGESSSGDYFYVDMAPGTYTVSVSTEKDETTSVTVTAGQAVYVKTEVSMGFLVGHVSPEVVANDKAEAEIQDCHFVGKDAPPAATAATTPAPATPTPAAAPSTTPTTPAAATGAPAQTPPQN